MSRSRHLVMAVLIGSAGAIGCAHCDTCDEFPTPCLGGDCLGGAAALPVPVMAMGPSAVVTDGGGDPIAAPAPGPGPFAGPVVRGDVLGATPAGGSPLISLPSGAMDSPPPPPVGR